MKHLLHINSSRYVGIEFLTFYGLDAIRAALATSLVDMDALTPAAET